MLLLAAASPEQLEPFELEDLADWKNAQEEQQECKGREKRTAIAAIDAPLGPPSQGIVALMRIDGK